MADTVSRLSGSTGPSDPKRIRNFATYFKNYMGISSIVTAALPIPITAAKLIPTYSAQTRFLSVYTSLFCFLLLGAVFFVRDRLAGALFRRRADGSFGNATFAWVPPILILACLLLIVSYHFVLYKSVAMAVEFGQPQVTSFVLEHVDERSIPLGLPLMLLYLGFFLSAEGAFILMATKEYLQDAIGIRDTELFAGSLMPRQCVLHISAGSNGEGARLFLDGIPAGTVPRRLEVTEGVHVLIAEQSGWRTFSTTVEIGPAERIRDLTVGFSSTA